MLERYGIVTRETVLAEGVPGGFSTLYAELGNLELLGTARRGYFVEGLGGAQFALPGAVERLRSLPETEGEFQVLAATDPANPYGAVAALAEAALRPPPRPRPRRPRPAARRRAARLRRARRPQHPPPGRARRGGPGAAAQALADAVAAGRLPKLGIEKVDGEPVIGSGHEQALLSGRLQPRPAQAHRLGRLKAFIRY